MSLKVWLPLNGDLKNLGCSDVIATTIGTVNYDNAGKIGKAFISGSTSRVTNGINLNSNLLDILGTTASIAVWVKPNGTHLHYNGTIISSGDWNNSCWSFGVSQDNTKVDVFSGRHNRYINCTVPEGQWTHLVSIFDNGKCTLYKNGEYIGELNGETSFISDASNTCIGRETYANGYFGFNGLINDVRIYDHCLSALEIKEISQGLVLHYKLDGDTQQNILTSTFSQTKTISSTGTNVYTSYWYIDEKYTSAMTEGTSLTVEYDYSVEDVTETTSYLYSQLNNARIAPIETMNYSFLTENPSGHHKWTFKITAAQATYATTNQSRIRIRLNTSNPGASFTISNIRLYFGEERNQIIDSSGYGNDGVITGNVTIETNDNNEGRYNISTYIPLGSTDYITTKNPIGNPSDAITMSVWFKSNNTSPGNNYHEIFNHATSIEYFEFAIHKTGYFRQGIVINGTRYVINGGSGLLDGNWHMLTATYDGTSIKRYIDGINISSMTQTVSGVLTGANGKFLFGHYGPNTGYHAKEAYLSDARIYATALSAEDILKLYQTPIEIDKSNKFHSFEFDESATNDIELFGGKLWTNSYGQKILNSTNMFTNYNINGEPIFSGSSSAGSEYIKIDPSGKTYYYDTEVSIAAGNQFYIGIERYDVDKTARSNNACVYIVSQKPSTDLVRKRFFGTVNLATDGTNPTDTISLRILNKWSGSTSDTAGTATIHYLSLREITGNPQVALLKKTGQVLTSEFAERDDIVYFYKNGFIGSSEIIER